MRWRTALLAVAGCALAWPAPPATAATQLSGFYEAFLRGQRGDESWQFDMPNHYFELRVLSDLGHGVEAFAEVSASSSRFRSISPGIDPTTQTNIDAAFVHDPKVFFNEGHVKLRGDHAELLVFSSQNRFWFSQPLLGIIDGNSFQDDFGGPRAQAVRVDYWGVGPVGGLAYYGDKATNGEDFAAGRSWASFAGNRVVLGSTYGRKDFGTSSSDYDLAAAVDLELALGELWSPVERFGRTTLVGEYGRNFSGWADDLDADGFQAELRDWRVGRLSGKLNYWYREPELYTGMTFRQNDDNQQGFWGELYYRLARKQVDLRYAYLDRTQVEAELNDIRLHAREHQVEAYANLKGGISGWVKYRVFEDNAHELSSAPDLAYHNLILELQAQNKLISVRPQVRFRDINTPFQVNGYGMEINLNVSSRWKFFSRFLNAEENTESRRTIFVQARYSGLDSGEFFLEYGDGGRSDRLTENDFFVGEGPSARDQDSERRIQAFLKLWF